MNHIGHVKNPCKECLKKEAETTGGLCYECQTIINMKGIDVKEYNNIKECEEK